MKRFKVDEQDFLFIQKIKNLKGKGFTDEDILQLDRNKEISQENMQKARLQTIKLNNLNIKIKQREIEYKRSQLKKRTSLEKHIDFLDEKKPLFMLENDIDKLNLEIEQINEIKDLTQGEYDANRN